MQLCNYLTVQHYFIPPKLHFPYLFGTYVMFMSTLTPGNALSLYMIATVEMTSTRVAVKPPCSVPPRLVCSSSTRISHTTLPGVADRMSTWRGKRECFRVVANQFLFSFSFLTDGAPLVQPLSS